MSEIKFCKDCKFSKIVEDHFEGKMHYCFNQKVKDPVTGIHNDERARLFRFSDNFCGTEAKYFEPKEKVDAEN